MKPEHVEFGKDLVREREARALTRLQVAKTTKIPERLIASLEEGRFADLPPDVFVRGFLRSYARCIGMDPAGMISRWEAAAAPTPAATPPTSVRGTGAASLPPVATGPSATAGPDVAATTAVPAPPVIEPVAAAAPVPPLDVVARPRTQAALDQVGAVVRALANVGQGARRMPLTLAVIILVIVATLTMSLLLRRPEPRKTGGISAATARALPAA